MSPEISEQALFRFGRPPVEDQEQLLARDTPREGVLPAPGTDPHFTFGTSVVPDLDPQGLPPVAPPGKGPTPPQSGD